MSTHVFRHLQAYEASVPPHLQAYGDQPQPDTPAQAALRLALRSMLEDTRCLETETQRTWLEARLTEAEGSDETSAALTAMTRRWIAERIQRGEETQP